MTDEEEAVAWGQIERFSRWPTRANAVAAWEVARRMGTSPPIPEGFRQAPSLKHGIIGLLEHHRMRALAPYGLCIAAAVILDGILRVRFASMPAGVHVAMIGLIAIIATVAATTWIMVGKQIQSVASSSPE